MRRTSLLLTLLAFTAVASATVYKWVDEKGVTHYSDQPHPGATKVEVAPAQTYSAPPPPPAPAGAPSTGSAAAQARPEGPAYRVCAITRPGNDETYLNPPDVTVTVKLDPALREGHKLTLSMDGKPLQGGSVEGGNFTVSPISRGTHQLTLAVTEQGGRAVCQAAATFHVRQPSVNAPANPNNPNRPKPTPR
jgi:hypothetical protein